MEALIPRAKYLDVRSRTGETPLHVAAEANEDEYVRLLIRHGADKNAQAWQKVTPLHVAAKGGKAACVTALIEEGANLFAQDVDGRTALYYAARANKLPCLEILIAAHKRDGSRVEEFTASLNKALEFATRYPGFEECETILKEAGAGSNCCIC